MSSGDRVLGAGHLVASLVLAALLYMWLVTAFPRLSPGRAGAITFGAAAGLGLVVEVAQFPIPEREPQLADAVLDITGSAIAVWALTSVPSTVLRRTRATVIVGVAGSLLVASTTAWIVFGSTETAAEQRCPGGVATASQASTRRADGPSSSGGRVDAGLVSLYDFEAGSAADAVGDLDLVARGDVEARGRSGVRLGGGDSVLTSEVPARPVVDALVDGLTVEAWVRPAELTQDGPARIVSSSGGVALDEANFHLGQDRHCLSVRLDLGGPEAEWWQLDEVFDDEPRAWHLAVTYGDGVVRVFVDGQLRLETRPDDADLSGWSDDYPLLVGNEVTGDRPFLGDVYLVAVYDRALNAEEVDRNHRAGP